MVINLTPHDVVLCDKNGVETHRIKASGQVARLACDTINSSPIDGLPITKTVFGQATGLPNEEHGVYYVVSQLIKTANPHRIDLLVPTQIVRSSDNLILGCQSLGI
jgi:hypothetical protein